VVLPEASPPAHGHARRKIASRWPFERCPVGTYVKAPRIVSVAIIQVEGPQEPAGHSEGPPSALGKHTSYQKLTCCPEKGSADHGSGWHEVHQKPELRANHGTAQSFMELLNRCDEFFVAMPCPGPQEAGVGRKRARNAALPILGGTIR
jgi:hypothetical protein